MNSNQRQQIISSKLCDSALSGVFDYCKSNNLKPGKDVLLIPVHDSTEIRFSPEVTAEHRCNIKNIIPTDVYVVE